jgi:hypothetical protein
MKFIRIFLLLLGLCGTSSVVVGDEALLSFVSSGSFTGSQLNQTLGWRFQLNSPVTLTTLGVYDHLQDGFVEPHEVGLWTSTGTLLADGILGTGASGTLLNSFRYVDVPDVTLPIGNYVLGAHFIAQFAEPFSDANLALVTHPFVAYQGRNSAGPGFQFPSNFLDASGFNFITSNFQFQLVPEPSASVISGLGVLILAFRRRRAAVSRVVAT